MGRPIVYCASSETLAVLELRVHVGNFLPREPFVQHAIEVPDTLIETLPSTLPVGWNVVPHSRMSQAVGDAWLVQRRSAALWVQSVHSNTEFNVLLNPLHDRMSSVRVDTTRKYGSDQDASQIRSS